MNTIDQFSFLDKKAIIRMDSVQGTITEIKEI